MLIDGSVIMLIGMGTVFSFLGILVLLIHLMTFLIKKLPVAGLASPASNTLQDIPKAEQIAVVIAAARAFAEGEKR